MTTFYEISDLEEPALAPQASNSRFLFFYALVIVTLVVFAGRIAFLQASQGTEYQTLADENRFRTILTNAPRGIIYDRNGAPYCRRHRTNGQP